MWSLSDLKEMIFEAECMAEALDLDYRELNDRELVAFARAMEYLLNEWYSTPELKVPTEVKPYYPKGTPKDKGVYEFLLELDKKLCQLHKELTEIKRNLMGRGYPRIYAILKNRTRDYLLGAMMAVYRYAREFSGAMKKGGYVYMTFLRKENFTDDDLGCLSGFICRKKPKENRVHFIANAKKWEQEVVWVKDNDLYVCSIPYTVILRPRDYHDFSSVEELLGVVYKV